MNLIDAMRTEYSRSKKGLRGALIINIGLYLATLASVFLSAGWQAKALGVIAGAAQIALFGLRYYSSSHFSLGEEIRRLAMLQDGLGIQPSELHIAKLRERVGRSRAAEPAYLGPYYESQLPRGPKRLLEITQESAFFTSSLSRTTARVLGFAAGIGLLAVILSFIVVVQAGISQSTLDGIAKIVVISMAFWAAGDLVSMAIQFNSVAQASDRVLHRSSNLLAHKTDLRDEAHSAAGEYNCAVLQAPPIPTTIYKWRQGVLNEAWRNRQNNGGTNGSAS